MSRIDVIGQNGNDGLHYLEETMGLLSATELAHLVEQGVIEGVADGAINAASIDLHLGDEFLMEADYDSNFSLVDLSVRGKPRMDRWVGAAHIEPGAFCLASTKEIFHLPDNISGMFILKSSMARAGLEHSQAGWADAGWHGSALTLELSNLLRNHTLRIKSGMAIGQIILFRHTPVPKEFSYATKGRYNGDTSVSEIKA
jgi:dCTP deaminase